MQTTPSPIAVGADSAPPTFCIVSEKLGDKKLPSYKVAHKSSPPRFLKADQGYGKGKCTLLGNSRIIGFGGPDCNHLSLHPYSLKQMAAQNHCNFGRNT